MRKVESESNVLLGKLLETLQELESTFLSIEDKSRIKPSTELSDQYKYSMFSAAYYTMRLRHHITKHLDELFGTVKSYGSDQQQELIRTAKAHFAKIKTNFSFISFFHLDTLMEESLMSLCDLYEFKISISETQEFSAPKEKKDTLEEEIPELIEQLYLFIKTGKGPDRRLDNALKQDKKLYFELAQAFYDKHKFWPMQFALTGSIYPDVIHYLIQNGAHSDRASEIKSGEIQELFKNIESHSRFIPVEIFKCLLDAGYVLTAEDRLALCLSVDELSVPISLKALVAKGMEFLLDGALLATKSIAFNDLKNLQYSSPIYIDLSKFSIDYFITQNGEKVTDFQLDILKNILIRGKDAYGNQESFLSRSLFLALRNNNLSVAYYLLNSYQYPSLILGHAESELRCFPEENNNNVKKYLSYCKKKEKYTQTDMSELKEMEESELKRMSHHQDLHQVLTEGAQGKLLKANQLMHLALTLGSEKKATTTVYFPRLTAINRLLPLNPFAVQYACGKMEKFKQHDEKFEGSLGRMAQYYKHYRRTTDHIYGVEIHDNYHRALLEYKRNQGSDKTPFSALQFIFEVLHLKLTLKKFFPKALLQLFAEYVTVQSSLVTPGIEHMFTALCSKEKCEECGVQFDPHLSIFQNPSAATNKDPTLNSCLIS